VNRNELEHLFNKRGFDDFRWIDPRTIVVAQWVRMKCLFGCGDYGRNAACPPNLPSIPECESFIHEYGQAAIFHFPVKVDKPEDRHALMRGIERKLLDLEREVFFAGHRKAFLLALDSCSFCEACPGRRAACKEPRAARPTSDALGIDVFAAVRSVGYPIEVLSDYSQTMNRYAFLLID
jgi:predicted metal-binding protein